MTSGTNNTATNKKICANELKKLIIEGARCGVSKLQFGDFSVEYFGPKANGTPIVISRQKNQSPEPPDVIEPTVDEFMAEEIERAQVLIDSPVDYEQMEIDAYEKVPNGPNES